VPALIPTDSRLNTLHPDARFPLCLLIDRVWKELGINLEPFDFYRGAAAQAVAFNTNASTKRHGESWHNICLPDGTQASLAAHVRVVLPAQRFLGFGDSRLEPPNAKRLHVDLWSDKVGERLTAEQMIYAAVGLKAEEIGWRTGARWSGLQDWCHIEWRSRWPTIASALASGEFIT